jgi:hypothetical protein
VIVTGGDGAINRVRRSVAKEPSVRVLDKAGRPVPGAAVAFVLPSDGPGGEFAGGQTSLVVTSDQNGEATASGLRANNIAGQFEIRVNASHRGSKAAARILQTNVSPASEPKLLTRKRIVILALVAGAVTGSVIAATSGGSNNESGGLFSSGSGTVLVPGTPSLGAPR